MNIDALVVEIRRHAATDVEFAKRLALICATFADRAAVDWGQGAGVMIRRVFKLD